MSKNFINFPICLHFGEREGYNESADEKCDAELTNLLMHLKKGDSLTADTYEIKEGETSPPKRYTSGSIILTMENAGQFIEDEELRAQIKGSGIGTSATRAEILKKLVNISVDGDLFKVVILWKLS